jgi:hypothetical protein
MSYDVRGWVEVTACEPEIRAGIESLWMPLFSLAPFGVGGDEISDYLFGLAKAPSGPGLFGGRGVPEDCSKAARASVEANRAFLKKHGEGDFGHTYASLQEIEEALKRPGAPADLGSAWHHVLASVRFALRPHAAVLRWCRIIVWANW